MSTKNHHQDKSHCPLAAALDIIGDHWTLLIIRDLMFMHRHEYKDMLNAWEEISTNILSNRLKKLTSIGIIDSIAHPESKLRKLYYLTESGKSLLPVLLEITIWGFAQKRSNKIPPHLKELLTGSKEKVTKQIHKSLLDWEKAHLIKPRSAPKETNTNL